MLNEDSDRNLSALLRAAHDAGKCREEIEAALDEADPRGALARILASAPEALPEVSSVGTQKVSSPPRISCAPLHGDAPPQLIIHLRSAAAQLQQLMLQWQMQARVLAPVVRERCQIIAMLFAEECIRLARYSKEACITFSSRAHRSLHVFLLQARRRTSDVILQANERILRSEALQLRGVEEQASHCSESFLIAELQRLPRYALVASACMSWRLASVLNGIVDAVVHELLHGKTVISKLGLTASLAVGPLSLYHYRDDLMCSVSNSSEERRGGALRRQVVLVQLAKNLQRMPPLFWLANFTSGAIVLQASRELCLIAVQSVLRMSSRRAFVAIAVVSAVFRSSLVGHLDRVAPHVSAALSTSWHQMQVFTRFLFAKFFLPHLQQSAARLERSKALSDRAIGKVSGTPGKVRLGDEGGVQVDSDSRNRPLFQGCSDA